MPSRTIKTILFAIIFVLTLGSFVLYTKYLCGHFYISRFLPEDSESITTAISDIEVLEVQYDDDGGAESKYLITVDYTVDGTNYSVSHETVYIGAYPDLQDEFLLIYQKNSPANIYLYSTSGYTYLTNGSVTLDFGYQENLFSDVLDIVGFVLYVAYIIGIIIAIVIIIKNKHINGYRKKTL